MAIDVFCHRCGCAFQVDERYAERKGKCAWCAAVVFAPAALKGDQHGIDTHIRVHEVIGGVDLGVITHGQEVVSRPHRRVSVLGYLAVAIAASCLGFAGGFLARGSVSRHDPVASVWDRFTTADRAKIYVSADPDMKLAMFEYREFPDESDPRRVEYRALLERVRRTYDMSTGDIAEAVNGRYAELQAKGLRASPREILELLTVLSPKDGSLPERKRSLDEDLTAYVILRADNRSHTIGAFLFSQLLEVQRRTTKDR
jgi:hypothetical protein